jgi:hypothetical protein
MAATTEPDPLRAELMAAAVVSAHNHVLRRWLRGQTPDPSRTLDEALAMVIALFTGPAGKLDGNGTTIVAFRTTQDIDALLPALRRLTED